MEFRTSKTRENLMRAFAGESQARNRYDMAASAAKKEGLQIIEKLFRYTADQEKAHAKVFYDQLKEFGGEKITINEAGYPVDIYDTTLKYLNAAVENEKEEHDVVYKEFAECAEKEGFTQIAKIFSNIASIEQVHSNRFKKYAKDLEEGKLFKKDSEVKWICTHCGFIYEGKEAPKYCPVCQHPQGYYMVFENTTFE